MKKRVSKAKAEYPKNLLEVCAASNSVNCKESSANRLPASISLMSYIRHKID